MKLKKNKQAEISSSTLIKTIIVIIVVAFVAMFFFRADINSWLRNLPGYTYNENDTLIDDLGGDEGSVGTCSSGKLIGEINVREGGVGSREQYIYMNDEKTNLYWDGDKNEAEIYLLKKDNIFGYDWFTSDIHIASVRGGEIKIDEKYYFVDSEDFHKIRFLFGYYEKDSFIEADNGIKYAIPNPIFKLDGARYYSGNLLCLDKKEDFTWRFSTSNYKEFSSKEKLYLNLDGKLVFDKEHHQIYLIPYIQSNSEKISFLYLEKEQGYFKILGSRVGGDINVGRIYPDGSVWIYRDSWNINQEDSNLLFPKPYEYDSINKIPCWDKLCFINREQSLGDEMDTFFRFDSIWETNLRVDYLKVKEFLENEYKK